MRALGVGAVYESQLAPLFEDAAIVGVLELELQAFWDPGIEIEHALIRAALRAESIDIAWSVDPTALFAALDSGRKPEGLVSVHSTMRIQAQ